MGMLPQEGSGDPEIPGAAQGDYVDGPPQIGLAGGGNSLSGNLWWNHLVNISRLAYVIPDAKIPTDEEIWTA